MREILFRGKMVDNGEWVYGYYYYTEHVDSHIIRDKYCNTYRIELSTIGQFTGLTDKNGVKIFEGDILKHFYFLEAQVDWVDGSFCWNNGEKIDYMDYNYACLCEVIGNIHDTIGGEK